MAETSTERASIGSNRRSALLAGCGDINTQVGLRLHEQGWSVTGVRRSEETRDLPFDVISQDLAAAAQDPLPQADAVVIALTSDSYDAAGYTRAYRDTLRGLAQGMSKQPAHVVLISSTSVLGDQAGQLITEAAAPQPERETAKVLLAAEADLSELFPTSAVTVLRAAGIYGPGRTRTVNRLQQQKPSDHARITNRIHRDDLVTAVVALLGIDEPPQLLHAVDTEPAALGTVLEFLAEQLQVPVPPDSGTGRSSGKSLDGSALHDLLAQQGHQLAYPSFREGYAGLLKARADQP